MAETTIRIGSQSVPMRATAALPRLYRIWFGRDILKDIIQLHKAFTEVVGIGVTPDRVSEEQTQNFFDKTDLALFENIAYSMARHGNPDIPDTPEEWLEGFETFSIYAVLPDILSLWLQNEQTTVKGKKKLEEVAEN